LPRVQLAALKVTTVCAKTSWLGSQRLQLAAETLAAGQGCKAVTSSGHNILPKHQLARVTKFSSKGSSLLSKHLLLATGANWWPLDVTTFCQNTTWLESQHVPPKVPACCRNTCYWARVQSGDLLRSQRFAKTPAGWAQNVFLQRFQLAAETLAAGQGCKAVAS